MVNLKDLSVYEQVMAVLERPELGRAGQLDWATLSGWDWYLLLSRLPEFSVHCDWSKLKHEDKFLLFIAQPQLQESEDLE